VIANWRKLVSLEDLVFHLGDVILGKNGTLFNILVHLPGKKVLVRGNHDHESNGWYMRNGFQFVAQGILHGGVWLTHAPQVTLPDGAVLNVHGHLHTLELELPKHCKLLSLERENYAPVEFNSFVGFSPMTRKLLGTTDEEGDTD
jgi:calcineurin-like phosphoesterase family protein